MSGLTHKALGVCRGEDIAADQQLPHTDETFDAGIDISSKRTGVRKRMLMW